MNHQSRRKCARCGLVNSGADESCRRCGLDFETIRSDDVPPYFTVVIVGHIMVPSLLFTEQMAAPSTSLLLAIALPLTRALVHRLALAAGRRDPSTRTAKALHQADSAVTAVSRRTARKARHRQAGR